LHLVGRFASLNFLSNVLGRKKILIQVTKGKFYIKKTSQFMYDSTHHVQFSCIGSSRDPTSPHRHEIVIAVLHISFKSLRSLKLCRNDWENSRKSSISGSSSNVFLHIKFVLLLPAFICHLFILPFFFYLCFNIPSYLVFQHNIVKE